MWNKDEVTGKRKQIEGTINTKVGKIIHDPQLEAVGEAQCQEGRAQQKAGKRRRKEAASAKQANYGIILSSATS